MAGAGRVPVCALAPHGYYPPAVHIAAKTRLHCTFLVAQSATSQIGTALFALLGQDIPLKEPGHRHWLAGDWQGLSHSSESDAERGTSISLVTSGSTLFGMRPPRLPLQTFSDNWHFDGQFSPNYLKAAAELSSRAESVGMRSQATGLPTPGATPRAQGRM